MYLRSTATTLLTLALLGDTLAAEYPAGGDRLSLRDPASGPLRRSVRFNATDEPGIERSVAPDPRVVGATLEIAGANPGDGSSGRITLAPELWVGLGKPEGSKGYKWSDRTRALGIKTVVFKSSDNGGTLTVGGGGEAWPYAITQPQGPIDVRFTVGNETFCVRFTDFLRNEAGAVSARDSAPPLSCGTGTSTSTTVPPTTSTTAPPTTTSTSRTTTTTALPTTTSTSRTTSTTARPSTTSTSRTTTTSRPPTTTTTLPPTTCGNGVVDGLEECDDGDTTGGDGCSSTCTLENASARCAGIPTVAGTGLDAVRVASGLSSPLHVTAPPLDPRRLFVTEQAGRVRVVRDGTLLPTPFLDITSKVSCCGEQGLLSVAFHPSYETNGTFFVDYTNTAGDTVVARYQVSGNPDLANPNETIILTIDQPYSNHNGGQLAFGPDGYLYIGMGDGGSANDPDRRAQNDGDLLGKILRIDVNAATYTIPPTNPFVGGGNPRDEIWAKGVRNPWRFSFDRGTGELYVADVGQGAREEVNVQPAAQGGLNYGWDVFEGSVCHEAIPPASACPSPPTGYAFPVLEYDHGQGCSITGGFVYRGCRMPDLRGTYFYSDICTPFIRTFRGVSGGVAQNRQDRTADVAPGGGLSIGGVSSFGEDARGEVYVVDYGDGGSGQGEVYRLVPGS